MAPLLQKIIDLFLVRVKKLPIVLLNVGCLFNNQLYLVLFNLEFFNGINPRMRNVKELQGLNNNIIVMFPSHPEVHISSRKSKAFMVTKN